MLCQQLTTDHKSKQVISHIITRWLFKCGCLSRVGNKAKDGRSPQQQGEASEHVLSESNPFRGQSRWAKLIRTISFQSVLGSFVAYTLYAVQHRTYRYMHSFKVRNLVLTELSTDKSRCYIQSPTQTIMWLPQFDFDCIKPWTCSDKKTKRNKSKNWRLLKQLKLLSNILT